MAAALAVSRALAALEIFSTAFFGGGRTAQRNSPMRGGDVDVSVKISFEEAAFGVKRDISISRQENCETCGGSGAKPEAARKPAPPAAAAARSGGSSKVCLEA